MATIFSLSSLLVFPFWALMILAPAWRWTARIIRSPWIAAPAALLYAVLILPRAGGVLADLASPTLPVVAALLGSDFGATVAWVHFLAFDLFVGRWIFLEGRTLGVSHWLLGPILVLTLMLGPLGLLAFLIVRAILPAARADSTPGAVGPTPGAADPTASNPRLTAAPLALTWDLPLLLRRAWRANWPLTLLGVSMLILTGVALVGLALDPRSITGMPAWMKPLKFAISIAVYSFTLLWLLTFVQGYRRLIGALSAGLALLFIGEMVVIVAQVLRGVTSHFNTATAFDQALFNAMGGMILVVWLLTLVAAILLIRQRLPDHAFAWALRLGLLISLVGAGLGMFMIEHRSPSQSSALAAGRMPPTLGAHSVGVEDGGAGLPVTGWSTEGGDLRVGHFVGLHGMQVLPLVGWLITRRGRRIGVGHRLAVVATVALAYLGLMALLTWQALRAQPLLAPDVTTLAALAALMAATALAFAAVAVHARRAVSAPSALIRGA